MGSPWRLARGRARRRAPRRCAGPSAARRSRSRASARRRTRGRGPSAGRGRRRHRHDPDVGLAPVVDDDPVAGAQRQRAGVAGQGPPAGVQLDAGDVDGSGAHAAAPLLSLEREQRAARSPGSGSRSPSAPVCASTIAASARKQTIGPQRPPARWPAFGARARTEQRQLGGARRQRPARRGRAAPAGRGGAADPACPPCRPRPPPAKSKTPLAPGVATVSRSAVRASHAVAFLCAGRREHARRRAVRQRRRDLGARARSMPARRREGAGAPPSSAGGSGCAASRERIVGSSLSGALVHSTRWLPASGSSSVLSRLLPAFGFSASASSSTITPGRPFVRSRCGPAPHRLGVVDDDLVRRSRRSERRNVGVKPRLDAPADVARAAPVAGRLRAVERHRQSERRAALADARRAVEEVGVRRVGRA